MTSRGSRSAFAFALTALAWVAALAACSRPLPEEGSEDARMYVARCGVCHRSYQPSVMTPAMWEIVVKRMDPLYPANGMPPLAGSERERIMAYLVRNAGSS